MSQVLTFQSTTFDIIDRNGQPWIQSRQLAAALGYKDESSVRKIYERNADEFTDEMTATVKMTVGITPVDVRVFSPRGCYAIAMFARTSVAKAFRVWVLDVLETLNKAEARQHPALDTDTRLSTVEDRRALNVLVDTWVSVAPITKRQAWEMIHAHFHVESIKSFTREELPIVADFVQARIDAVPRALPESNVTMSADDDELERLFLSMVRLVKEFRALDQDMHAILDRAARRQMRRFDARRSFALANLRAAESMGNSLGHMLDAMKHHAQAVLRAELM